MLRICAQYVTISARENLRQLNKETVAPNSNERGAPTMKAPELQSNIPRYELEALARCLLPDIQTFFESEEGQREFAEWQEKQKEKDKTKTAK